jgi:hypothetical protein
MPLCKALSRLATVPVSACAGQERFAAKPDEDRVAELEALQDFLQQAAAAFDAKQQTVLEPLDRLKQLLAAKDKRATLLEMAGDAPLTIVEHA